MTALSRFGIELYNDFMSSELISAHISFTILMRSALFQTSSSLRSGRILINRHTFSIMLISGLWLGHVKVSIASCSFHAVVAADRCTGQLSSCRIHGLFSKFLVITGHRFVSNTLIYFAELMFPSTSVKVPTPSIVKYPQNKADIPDLGERASSTPRQSRLNFSSAFLQTYIFLSVPKTTFISSLNMILYQSRSTVHLSFPLHQSTIAFLFFDPIVILFVTTHLLYPKSQSLLLTVLVANCTGALWLYSAVISTKLCRLLLFTSRESNLSSRSDKNLFFPFSPYFLDYSHPDFVSRTSERYLDLFP